MTKVWRKSVNRYWRYRGNIKLPRESRMHGRRHGQTTRKHIASAGAYRRRRLKNKYYQGPRFFVANLAKICDTICEIPQQYYSQIPYILRPVGVVALTDNTSKYKEFIVICNTKTHYIYAINDENSCLYTHNCHYNN